MVREPGRRRLVHRHPPTRHQQGPRPRTAGVRPHRVGHRPEPVPAAPNVTARNPTRSPRSPPSSRRWPPSSPLDRTRARRPQHVSMQRRHRCTRTAPQRSPGRCAPPRRRRPPPPPGTCRQRPSPRPDRRTPSRGRLQRRSPPSRPTRGRPCRSPPETASIHRRRPPSNAAPPAPDRSPASRSASGPPGADGPPLRHVDRPSPSASSMSAGYCVCVPKCHGPSATPSPSTSTFPRLIQARVVDRRLQRRRRPPRVPGARQDGPTCPCPRTPPSPVPAPSPPPRRPPPSTADTRPVA